jgi:hypothetical protein
MCGAEQIKRLLIPEVDSCLQPNRDLSFREFLQELANRLADTEDLVNPIDVINSTRNERVHFLQYGIDIPLPELISEQSLVAECARPRAATRKFQLSTPARTMEYVVPMRMQLDWIILKTQRAEFLHVRYADTRTEMDA